MYDNCMVKEAVSEKQDKGIAGAKGPDAGAAW